MKKKCIMIILILLSVECIFCGCSYMSGGDNVKSSWESSERSETNARMDKFIEALGNRDKETIKSMFSTNAVSTSENFDSNLDVLLDFYEGDFVSYDDKGSVNTEDTRDGSDRLRILYSTYDVTTTEQIYRIAIKDVTIDTKDQDNIGILSFYIIKFEDDTDPDFAYVGDGKETPGINFNIKNVLPY